ncbi:hypothetical protein AB0870_09895 [Microbacterium proteolyticum]|uniref:hypothetical protein n=1 Tax=Microbacterium proteolyticum TaxID=1572644 RepID=UPI00241651E1|nr:hypothetical protein [Microbacterium proteolyticum]
MTGKHSSAEWRATARLIRTRVNQAHRNGEDGSLLEMLYVNSDEIGLLARFETETEGERHFLPWSGVQRVEFITPTERPAVRVR